MTRRKWAIATVIAAPLFGASFAAIAVLDPLPRVVWNASASAPIGLYRIEPLRDPPLGALVAVTPPPALARWLAERGYLGERVPLLKHVAARPGQIVSSPGSVTVGAARCRYGKAAARFAPASC
jgi:type IV secretory pathway protease TraF